MKKHRTLTMVILLPIFFQGGSILLSNGTNLETVLESNKKNPDYRLISPLRFDLDDSLNIYIIADLKANVRMYDSGGKFVRAIGKKGDGEGEFIRPTSIDIVDQQIIIMDGHRIHRFSMDGE